MKKTRAMRRREARMARKGEVVRERYVPPAEHLRRERERADALIELGSLECKVVHEVDFGGSHRWFIGEIKAAHIDENYTRDSALMFWAREFRRVGEVIPVEEK